MEATERPERLGFCPDRLGRIAPWMRRYVDGGRFPFACTVIARHGEIAYCAHTGQRDLEAGLPFEFDTVVRVYSMTKPITSIALMMLYEEGLLHLDDPVEAYLPEFADRRVLVEGATRMDQVEPATEKMTIHHLLTHRSGLTYGFNGGLLGDAYRAEKVDFGPTAGGLDAATRRLCGLPLLFNPGTCWNYSVSTDVIGRLVEVVSGQSLDRFFAERIFSPLGMHDTGFSIADDATGRLANLYTEDGDGGMRLIDEARRSRYRCSRVDTFSGGGGLLSTAADYLKIAELLRRGGTLGDVRLLGPRTVRLMAANHLDGDLATLGPSTWAETSFSGVGFGLGVWVMLDPARAQLFGSPGDYGWGGLASTVFWVDPVEDLCVLFLTQLTPSDSTPYRKELRALVHQAMVD